MLKEIPEPNELTPAQIQAIIYLAQGRRSKEIAKDLGVTPQTISAWKKKPTFLACLNQTKFEVIENARDSLRTRSEKAIESLAKLAEKAENEETRRRAARDIIELSGLAKSLEVDPMWGIGLMSEKAIIDQDNRNKKLDEILSKKGT